MTQEAKLKTRSFAAITEQQKRQKQVNLLTELIDADYRTYKLQFNLHKNELVAETLARLNTEIDQLRSLLILKD